MSLGAELQQHNDAHLPLLNNLRQQHNSAHYKRFRIVNCTLSCVQSMQILCGTASRGDGTMQQHIGRAEAFQMRRSARAVTEVPSAYTLERFGLGFHTSVLHHIRPWLLLLFQLHWFDFPLNLLVTPPVQQPPSSNGAKVYALTHA